MFCIWLHRKISQTVGLLKVTRRRGRELCQHRPAQTMSANRRRDVWHKRREIICIYSAFFIQLEKCSQRFLHLFSHLEMYNKGPLCRIIKAGDGDHKDRDRANVGGPVLSQRPYTGRTERDFPSTPTEPESDAAARHGHGCELVYMRSSFPPMSPTYRFHTVVNSLL